MKKVATYLPIFTGFYENPLWDTSFDEENEIDYINEIREQKGLRPITWDDLQFDYREHQIVTAKKITNAVESLLSNYVHSIKFEELISPRECNFSNDSINVVISPNVDVIKSYLLNNWKPFEEYIKEQYTSYDGFISSYENNATEFMMGSPFEHKHRLGSILNFIAENEEITEEDVFSDIVGEIHLECKNYEELTTTVEE